MIRFLIHLAADKGARQIEAGSPIGAAIGAIIGCAVGVTTAYLLYQADIIERSWEGPAVAFGLGFALAGGFFGSLAPIGKKTLEPWNEKLTDTSTIRVTNYNHALGPLLVLLLLSALLVFVIAVAVLDPAKLGHELTGKFDPTVLLLPVVYIGALFLAMRSVWWVELGPQLRIKRLFKTRSVPAQELTNWFFRSNSGRMSRIPLAGGPVTLVLLFQGGHSVELPIKATLTAPAAELLGRHVKLI